MPKKNEREDLWQVAKAERVRSARAKKKVKREPHLCGPEEAPDLGRIVSKLCSADEAARAKAVREVCPCRAGWESFQQSMEIVSALQKDASPVVRRAALHVFEDAFEMQSRGLPTSPQTITNEMAATKRRTRGRAEVVEGDLADARDRERARERSVKREAAGRFGRPRAR